METRVFQSEQYALVRFYGRLTGFLEGDQSLRDLVTRLLPPNNRPFLIDLSEVEFANSHGIRTLVSLRAMAAKAGFIHIYIVGANTRVLQVLSAMKLIPGIFSAYPHISAALQPRQSQ